MRKRSEAVPEQSERMEPVGAELDSRLKAAEDTDSPQFADRPPREVPASPALERMVEKTFVKEEDFESTYDRLFGMLKALEGRGSETGFLRDNLSRAAAAYQEALSLTNGAKRSLSNWEYDNLPRLSAFRDKANDWLQSQKQDGKRNKAITDKDLDEVASMLYPKEYPSYLREKRERELTVRNIEGLIESIGFMNRNLQTLCGKT